MVGWLKFVNELLMMIILKNHVNTKKKLFITMFCPSISFSCFPKNPVYQKLTNRPLQFANCYLLFAFCSFQFKCDQQVIK